MCTAVNFTSSDNYFGRNLDLERSYGEQVVITPRNYRFNMRTLPCIESHYAMIGMATVVDGYPLYYEATNEKGLSMAGLNFPDNACYNTFCEGKKNVAPFELIPYILGCCSCVDEALEKIENGRGKVTVEILERYSKVFGVELNLNFKDNVPPSFVMPFFTLNVLKIPI